MSGRVIPFPSRVGREPEFAIRGSALPEFRAAESVTFAVLSIEFRNLGSVQDRLALDRCVNAALRPPAAAGARVELAGTPGHPVVEARFEGDDAPAKAVRAAMSVVEAVRDVSRRRFAPAGALVQGRVSRSTGLRVIEGYPDRLVTGLRERAAPGQVLLGGPGWSRIRGLKAPPASGIELVPGGATTPAFVLQELA
ncbi:MAG: hypothetical protein WD276_01025 [Actinomycetota bacterium]